VWDQDEPAELTITSMDGAITSLLAPDPFHALSSQSFRATSFHLARPASPQPQTASIAVSGDRFFAKRMPPNQRDRNARGIHRRQGNLLVRCRPSSFRSMRISRQPGHAWKA
jgi:hypothetical protein